MTHKELAEKVREYFKTTKKRAVDPIEQTCCYRTSDGRCCVVGSLILDEYYDARFETVGVKRLLDNDPFEFGNRRGDLLRVALGKSGVPMDDSTLEFLAKCQDLHDDYTAWECDGFAESEDLEDIIYSYLGER